MKTEEILEPPTGDVASQFIHTIDGSHGRCFIGWIGGMPEREYAFVYRDIDYHFYFYADTVEDGALYDVIVKNASTVKFTGPPPRIRADDVERILDNIRSFFESRMFINSSKPRPENERFRKLIISWRIGH